MPQSGPSESAGSEGSTTSILDLPARWGARLGHPHGVLRGPVATTQPIDVGRAVILLCEGSVLEGGLSDFVKFHRVFLERIVAVTRSWSTSCAAKNDNMFFSESYFSGPTGFSPTGTHQLSWGASPPAQVLGFVEGRGRLYPNTWLDRSRVGLLHRDFYI